MPITSYNDIINRIGGGFSLQQPLWGEHTTAVTATLISTDTFSRARVGDAKPLPSGLPTGVTAYIPTRVSASITLASQTILLAKMINLGSLDISGASGTFTDGSSMPTITELGVSRTTASAVLMEVTSDLSALPGTITITYVDQNGNAAETTAAMTLTTLAASRTVGAVILNSGDTGVQDITAAARSGGTVPTGTIKFWGLVPISFLAGSPGTIGVCVMDNLVTSAFNWVKLGAGDIYGTFVWGSTGTKAILGDVFFVGDN